MFYDIEHGAARATMSQVAATASQLPGEAGRVGEALKALFAALPHSPVSASAVAGYAEDVVVPGVSEVIGCTERALAGGRSEVSAYQQGDMVMLQAALAAAAQAPTAADMPGAGAR